MLKTVLMRSEVLDNASAFQHNLNVSFRISGPCLLMSCRFDSFHARAPSPECLESLQSGAHGGEFVRILNPARIVWACSQRSSALGQQPSKPLPATLIASNSLVGYMTPETPLATFLKLGLVDLHIAHSEYCEMRPLFSATTLARWQFTCSGYFRKSAINFCSQSLVYKLSLLAAGSD